MNKWLVMFALLSGCATIDPHTPPPADWPPLIVVPNKTDIISVQRKCASVFDVLVLNVYGGCVEYDFCALSCTVTYWLDAAFAHEEMHCRGYQHHGDTRIADGFLFWQANNSCGMPLWKEKP